MANITASLSPIPAPPPPPTLRVILQLELSKQEASWLLDLTRSVGGTGPVREFTDSISHALQEVDTTEFEYGDGPFATSDIVARSGFQA